MCIFINIKRISTLMSVTKCQCFYAYICKITHTHCQKNVKTFFASPTVMLFTRGRHITVYHERMYRMQQKKYPLKFLAIICATVWNFNVKFHTLITCSCLRKKVQVTFDILLLQQSYGTFCETTSFTFKNLVAYCNE